VIGSSCWHLSLVRFSKVSSRDSQKIRNRDSQESEIEILKSQKWRFSKVNAKDSQKSTPQRCGGAQHTTTHIHIHIHTHTPSFYALCRADRKKIEKNTTVKKMQHHYPPYSFPAANLQARKIQNKTKIHILLSTGLTF